MPSAKSTVKTKSAMVSVGMQRLRVTVENPGKGRPLLLINGIGATGDLFDPFRQHFGDRETIAFDAPGVGGSPAPALPYSMRKLAGIVAGLVDELGHDTVDVLGLSWGGALAQEFARRHKNMVRRLILTALLDEHARQRAARPPSGRGYMYQLSAIQRWSSLPWLHRISHRTLVLAGDDDPIIRLVNARLLTGRIPDARLHMVEGGGHLFLFTRAEEMAKIVADFLDDGATKARRQTAGILLLDRLVANDL